MFLQQVFTCLQTIHAKLTTFRVPTAVLCLKSIKSSSPLAQINAFKIGRWCCARFIWCHAPSHLRLLRRSPSLSFRVPSSSGFRRTLPLALLLDSSIRVSRRVKQRGFTIRTLAGARAFLRGSLGPRRLPPPAQRTHARSRAPAARARPSREAGACARRAGGRDSALRYGHRVRRDVVRRRQAGLAQAPASRKVGTPVPGRSIWAASTSGARRRSCIVLGELSGSLLRGPR